MDSLIIDIPEEGLYPSYYERYFALVEKEKPIDEIWLSAMQDGLAFWNYIAEENADFRYAEGKWSIKEILGHVIDTERIFIYRALCISRGETKVLPGFDHDKYVDKSGAHYRPWVSLLQEYQSVKQASLDFILSLNKQQWQTQGQSETNTIAMVAFAYVIPGHDKHHQNIVRDRYLKLLKA